MPGKWWAFYSLLQPLCALLLLLPVLTDTTMNRGIPIRSRCSRRSESKPCFGPTDSKGVYECLGSAVAMYVHTQVGFSMTLRRWVRWMYSSQRSGRIGTTTSSDLNHCVAPKPVFPLLLAMKTSSAELNPDQQLTLKLLLQPLASDEDPDITPPRWRYGLKFNRHHSEFTVLVTIPSSFPCPFSLRPPLSTTSSRKLVEDGPLLILLYRDYARFQRRATRSVSDVLLANGGETHRETSTARNLAHGQGGHFVTI